MKKYKKTVFSIVAIFLMCNMCIVPVGAVVSGEPALIDGNYYEEIVVFSKMDSNDSLSVNARSDFSECAQSNVNQAIVGVLSLNLSDQGFSYIEDACLTELNEIANDPNCQLNEYSVLVPRGSSSPAFYATYKNTDFYAAITSKSNITLQKNHFGEYEKLAKWAANTVSLLLSINGTRYASLAWSAVTANLPANYEVHTSDWTDYYININPTNRAIYVKDGDTYRNVANREYGYVRAYNIYHYNDATAPEPAVTTAFPSAYYPDVTIYTNGDLLYVAYEVYRTGALASNSQLKNLVSIKWS